MLLEPDERTASVEEVASELHAMSAAPNCTVLVAEPAGKLVGYVEANGGRFRRNRVPADVVIGVAAAASGGGWAARSWPGSCAGLAAPDCAAWNSR